MKLEHPDLVVSPPSSITVTVLTTTSLNDTVKVFDVLMINGRVIADAPLHMRKRALFDSSKDADNQYRVFTPVHGRLDFAEQWEGRTGEDIGAFLEEVVRTK